MKFHNRQKRYRESQWTKVISKLSVYVGRTWCEQHQSTGKFYAKEIGYDYSIFITHWWFEDPTDAVVFKLRWNYENK